MKCTASDQNVDFHSHKYLICAVSFGPGRESHRADLFTAFSEQFVLLEQEQKANGFGKTVPAISARSLQTFLLVSRGD